MNINTFQDVEAMLELGPMEEMYRLSVANHKTANKYGPSVVLIPQHGASMFQLLALYKHEKMRLDTPEESVQMEKNMALLTPGGLPLQASSVNR